MENNETFCKSYLGISMKARKTPLRYPGGKSRALKTIFKCIPDKSIIKEYREPFVGGGSVAIEITRIFREEKKEIDVWVNDLYKPLFIFWVVLRDNGEDLTNTILDLKKQNNTEEKAKELFLESKNRINDEILSNLDRAVSFYIVNKCSFSGLTESSSFSIQASVSNFSIANIESLKLYSNIIKEWKITNKPYQRLLSNEDDIFIYHDPPYEIKDKLYGKNGNMHVNFNHDVFAKKCNSYKSPMLISYNSDNCIKNRFPNWNAVEFDHTYTMRSVGDYNKNQSSRKELLLMNYSPSLS